MSPDSVETRLRYLESSVARLEQRMNDLLERLTDQFTSFDTDIRAFAPLVKDIIELQNDLRRTREDVTACVGSFRDLNARLDREDEAREARLEALRLERKQDRRYQLGVIFTTFALLVSALGVYAALA